MTPLLTGAAADRARDAIRDIAAALRDPGVRDADPGLSNPDVGRGSAGAAIFFAELAAENGDDKDSETALAFLDAALESAADDDRPTALLYPGTIGVGWAMAYLEGRLLDRDPDENDVDVLAAHALAAGNWPSADLIRGVAGVGVYLLERRRPAEAVVARLAEMATATPEGFTWYVDPATCLPDRREAYPDGYYDAGMAHGQAGVMAVLAHLTQQGETGAKDLLRGATDWLLAHRLPDGHGPGRYPTIVPNDDRPAHGGRLAWCYGDPGVAAGLLAAGRALDDDDVVKEATELALNAASRAADPDAAVVDAPLCHGSTGLLQIFHRLYRQLDDERLADAARHWFEVALSQRRDGEPVAGFGSVRPEDGVKRYEPLAGFLEGATGVGLALLAATSERDPDWDSLLLTKPVA